MLVRFSGRPSEVSGLSSRINHRAPTLETMNLPIRELPLLSRKVLPAKNEIWPSGLSYTASSFCILSRKENIWDAGFGYPGLELPRPVNLHILSSRNTKSSFLMSAMVSNIPEQMSTSLAPWLVLSI